MPARKVDYFDTSEMALSQIRGNTFQTLFQKSLRLSVFVAKYLKSPILFSRA